MNTLKETVKKTTVIFTTGGSAATKKAVEYFKDNELEYKAIFNCKDLTRQDIIYLVSRAGGFDELLADRSNIYKENIDFLTNPKTTTLQLVDFISQNPKVLRFPIILDHKRILMGFNEDEISAFLPRPVKLRMYLDRAKSAGALLPYFDYSMDF